jgi:hypothetical protein
MDTRTLSDQGIRCKNEIIENEILNEQAQFERTHELTRPHYQMGAYFDELARNQWKKPARLRASCYRLFMGS